MALPQGWDRITRAELADIDGSLIGPYFLSECTVLGPIPNPVKIVLKNIAHDVVGLGIPAARNDVPIPCNDRREIDPVAAIIRHNLWP